MAGYIHETGNSDGLFTSNYGPHQPSTTMAVMTTYGQGWNFQTRPEVPNNLGIYYQQTCTSDYPSHALVTSAPALTSVVSPIECMSTVVKSENRNNKSVLTDPENPQNDKHKKKKRRRECSPVTSTRLKKLRRRKANDRERNRMHGLNDALEDLR